MMKTLREVHPSSQFRKDLRKARKQGKDMALLDEIIVKLANDIPLPPKHRDHALQGNWAGHRECHLTPDWLLVYRKTDNAGLLLLLVRADSHSNLDF